MSGLLVTITANGVLDQTRAETLAARLRAAVRNGKTTISIAFGQGTVLASPGLLAFLLRTAEVLRNRGGQLSLSGDPAVLELLQAMGISAAIASPAASSPGVES